MSTYQRKLDLLLALEVIINSTPHAIESGIDKHSCLTRHVILANSEIRVSFSEHELSPILTNILKFADDMYSAKKYKSLCERVADLIDYVPDATCITDYDQE